VDFVDRLVDKKITEAIERGEMDTPTLAGTPIPDLDTMRPPGWWAEQFVEREKARLQADDDRPVNDMTEAWRRQRRDRW
jgi:hypothetical protein